MPEDTVIDLDTIQNQNQKPNDRQKAGIDMSGDPNETLFIAPQIYISLGIGAFVCLITIIVIACGGPFYASGCFLFTILLATIAFIPDPMGHWIHWIVQCIFWMLLPLALIGQVIIVLKDPDTLKFAFITVYKADGLDRYNAFVTWTHVSTWVLILPAIINALLVLRMTIFAVQNRGG